jgi:5-methylcytosine-specific restriction endonuclease McrA
MRTRAPNFPDQSLKARKARKAAYHDKWNRENPERVKAWYTKDIEHSRVIRAKWHKENPERKAVANAKWQEANPEYMRVAGRKASRKRRVLKRVLPYVEHVTPMPASGLCPYCRVPMIGKGHELNAPSLDHIVPLAKGGHHISENTMMICRQCNTIKGDRPLSYLLDKIAARDVATH